MLLSLLLPFVADAQAPFSLEWWAADYPWSDDGEYSPAKGDKSFCDTVDNSRGTWPINFNCNNAGKCIPHDTRFQEPIPNANYNPDGFSWGKCECANPSDDDNFVNEDQYDSYLWDYQLYTGVKCTITDFKLYGTVSYLIKISSWSPGPGSQGVDGVFTCATGGSGNGETFDKTAPLDASAVWRTTPDMTPLVKAVVEYNEYWQEDSLRTNGYVDYLGKVVPWYQSSVYNQHCRICHGDHNRGADLNTLCRLPTDPNRDGDADFSYYGDEGSGGYMVVSFATNYNTYYAHECEKTIAAGAPGDGVMPEDLDGYQLNPKCDWNYDDGYSAHQSFRTALFGNDTGVHHREHYLELATEDTSNVVFQWEGEEDVYGMNWSSDIQITRTTSQVTETSGITTNSLRFPSFMPTMAPTRSPTPTPTSAIEDCFVLGYTHKPEDLKFLGIAQAGNRGCRWGLDESWPGGDEPDMCESPYIVCLPQENTPSGFPVKDGPDIPYWATDAEYTIDRCKMECAYDQRCNGFEFLPTAGAGSTMTGTCKLIDDIPVEMGSPSANPGITTESQLFATAIGDLGGAVCYMKDVECNPYFGADDLTDVMLACYCPNNRKGFYTKNVERTVEATHFCGDDPNGDITDRIKNAQANRMFHLCENWCLFNTQNPRTESWYHDPWEDCWREQYAGVGTHRSYCFRVIRDPFTIEQYFIDQRSANMCNEADADKGFGNNQNTPSPVMGPVVTTKWVLADPEDSCDDACTAESLTCNNEDIMTMVNGQGSATAANWVSAGYDCDGEYTDANDISPNGQDGWALPAVGPSGQCILRHPNANNQGTGATDLYVPCSLALGVGYQRLCACGTEI